MKRDTGLAIAVIGGIAFSIVVGVSSSPTPERDSPDRPVAVYVTYAESGRLIHIDDPLKVASITQWLDETFENPRLLLGRRLMSPPTNRLLVEFGSGEQRLIFFSGPDPLSKQAQDVARRAGEPDFVVQFNGRGFVTEVLPQSFAEEFLPEYSGDVPGGYRGSRSHTTED